MQGGHSLPQVKLMFMGHFACRRYIPTLPPAYGLWGKLSDRNAGFVKRFIRSAEKKLS